MCFGDIHCVDEAGAGTVDVDAGALQAQAGANDAAQAGRGVLIHHVGANEIVDVLRTQPGHVQGFAAGLDSQVFQLFRRNDVAGPDARTGHDPLIRRVKELGKHVVGDHFGGNGTASSDNFHINGC